MNKAVDNQRKHLRKICKEYDEFKHRKWALLKNQSGWTGDERKKLKRAFFLAPELKALYEQKEKLRNIFEHRFTTSIIEGINNSIKTMKSMYLGFRNFQNFKNKVLLSFI